MGVSTTEKVNNRLSDGRVVRALDGTYTQVQLFGLKGRVPCHESIMGVKDHDDSLNISGAWRAIDVTGWWRTNRYGVYARGFEKKLDKPVGARVVLIEDGVSYTFEVPDVKNPLNKDKGLRQATGMLDFALERLQYDEGKRIVSVASDFNPETDVTVRDIMRPRGWALVDADGYPLRLSPSNADVSEARYSFVRRSDEFNKKSTGYHGSVARNVLGGGYRRNVIADFGWQDCSGVALVGREAAAPLESEAPASPTAGLQLIRNPTELIVKGTPEQLDAAIRLLQSLKQ